MALLNPLSGAFGLDIGDRSFKLAQVKKGGLGKPPRLSAWGEITVPEGVFDRGDVVNMDEAAKVVAKLVREAKGKLKGRAVVACLPEVKTFIKLLEADPAATDKQLAAAVKKEIEQNIPLPVEEIYYDWEVVEESAREPAAESAAAEAEAEKEGVEPEKKEATEAPAGEEEKKKTRMLLIGAAPKNIVDGYTKMLESAGLAPIALEVEAAAISRAVAPKEENVLEAVGVLDIGATRSSLIIYDNGLIRMSISIPISGVEITSMISQSLGVSKEEAETLKRECGLDPNRCEAKMWNILLPLIEDMTEKIRNALRFYKVGFPGGKKVEKIYLCGGGAQFHEIDSVLSRKLAMKVRRADAFANLFKPVPKDFPADRALGLTTAIGLALRAAEEKISL